MVLDNILPLKRLKEIDEDKAKIKHLAFDISDVSFLEKLQKEKEDESLVEIESILSKKLELIKWLSEFQKKYSVPILTIYLTKKKDKTIFYGKIYEKVNDIIDFLEKFSATNDTRITIIGKWYDVPNSTTELIRNIVDKTKQYQSFFINLCVNYDGREEIIDSCRLIGHKVKVEKMNPADITEESFRENIYTSRFSPPERIIFLNKKRKLSSFLLWDSSESSIYFTEKLWSETSQKELERYFQ